MAGPDGVAHELWPDPTVVTAGELARAVGVDPAQTVAIDGVEVDPATTLARTPVRTGSVIGRHRRPIAADGPTPAILVTVVQVAGPAIAAPIALGPGRHLVGRTSAAVVRLADPSVEPHHAVLDIGADGSASILQLAGRVPIIVGGIPVDGVTAVPRHVTVELGASRLLVGAPPPAPAAVATAASPCEPWRHAVLRRPRPAEWAPDPTADACPVVVPPRLVETPSAGWSATGAIVSLVGAGVVAAVLRQPLFAMLGAVGAIASLATAGGGRIRHARRLRRDRRRDDEARVRFTDEIAACSAHLRELTVAEAISRVRQFGDPATADLWARRGDDRDAFRVIAGWGSSTTAIPLRPDDGDELRPDLRAVVEAASVLRDVPVAIDLSSVAGRAIALTGADAHAVARSLVVQLALQCGPADWRLRVVTDDVSRFGWAAWLPHAASGHQDTSVVDRSDRQRLGEWLDQVDGESRRTVVLTDVPSELITRTAVLRRLLDAESPVTMIVVVGPGDVVPACCRSVLEIGTRCRARWSHGADGILGAERLHVAGVSADTAAAVARRVAGFSDPEAAADPGTDLATDVRLADLADLADLPRAAGAIVAAWRACGADPPPGAPVGVSRDGIVEIDLVRDGPHALIAGTTGSGKSEVLRTLVVAMAARLAPEHVTFVLIDYKGGATFDACADLPHTVGLVTDLDEGLAARALVSLEAEVRRRERVLRTSGSADLAGHRATPGTAPLPRLVVVIDEFAALAVDLPDFVAALVTIAQRGRSLGVHLVLATQRPAGVVDDHIRANTNLRLALRLHDRTDAIDVVGDPAPAALPRGIPGRAVMRLGPGDLVEFQVAQCTAPGNDHEQSELGQLVGEIRRAAGLSGVAAPHRPWCPPLPTELGDVDEPDAVGLVDEPALQRLTPLRWDRSRGNLALLGALGSGTTTTLRTVLTVAAAALPPHQLHVYVVDARGDCGLDTLPGEHCADVIRVHESERVDRLVRRLAGELDSRRSDPTTGPLPDVIVAIDGLSVLRDSLDHVDRATTLTELDRVLADGPAVGIATIAVLDGGRGGGYLLAKFAQRWVFHLDDRADAPMLGVAPARVPPAIPGRLVVAGSGLEAQVARLERPPMAGPGGPAPVAVMPAVVARHALGAVPSPAGSTAALLVGLDVVTLAPAALHVPAGEHVVVVGPARSGRSSALITLIEAWREQHPDAPIDVVCPVRSSPLVARYGVSGDADHVGDAGALGDVDAAVDGAVDGDTCRLIAVDDCERFDDPGGRFAARLARLAGVTVFAAGRGDAMRVAHGHWSAVCRRSRLGLVMAAAADLDGDLLGVALPRRVPIAPRPGLAWLVDGTRQALVQLALDGHQTISAAAERPGPPIR